MTEEQEKFLKALETMPAAYWDAYFTYLKNMIVNTDAFKNANPNSPLKYHIGHVKNPL